jgi:hypothetical protein
MEEETAMIRAYAVLGSLTLALVGTCAWAQERLSPSPYGAVVTVQYASPQGAELAQEKPKVPEPKPADQGAKPLMPAPNALEQTPAPVKKPAPPRILPSYPPPAPTFVDPRTNAWRQQLFPPAMEEEAGSVIPPAACCGQKKSLRQSLCDWLF